MDFHFGEQEERLRAELRAFLKENLPDEDQDIAGPGGLEDNFERAQEFNRKLAARGWIAPAWPKEYGGLGASIYEQMVFNEELGYARAPDTGTRGFGVGMIGPTLIVHGTEEQKREHLPRITSGEAIWCQGYSEPGAGSDLASLQTRAVRD
ncbi:MAG TPA: acyl-CoA dehydrogenase family protein, partial [Dehalococcoidia bacterium]